MAEIKNTFLKSKMNKDLDDRILPNGEYRDANNISVGRSEDSDVGALENVIGNALITSTQLDSLGLEIIGTYSSDSTNKIFVFLTDYTDPNISNPTASPTDKSHYIYSYDNTTQTYTLLVSGSFLNFSTTNRIIGINLIESLLFWTDNRNQPRKININLAVSAGSSTRSNIPQETYYTEEHQISVAKYSPYLPIDLYTKTKLVVYTGAELYFDVVGDRVTELSAFIGGTLTTSSVPVIDGNLFVFVSSVNLHGNNTRINITNTTGLILVVGQSITLTVSTMSNKDDDTSWPGDPTYLENRYVRFSYRFKFDDNEYSIMAPFTQIAYIPKQKGYWLAGDEDAAYQSTIVDFMKNSVQNIGLVIPLPDVANRMAISYKISEVDILFRESDAIAIKVLESIPVSKISAESRNTSEYTYDYQSRKPYKTLSEAQTTRVYDKVPVKAFAQESAGNRIIYGNFVDKYTPPSTVNYNCKISHKSSSGIFNNNIEYPNSSVKRNRNYQMGFVLADKFGRQSPVILSSVDNGAIVNGSFYSGSTIYSPYDDDESNTNVRSWFGDAIQMVINSPITSNVNNLTGTPGLYAIIQQNETSGDGFATVDDTTNIISGSGNPNNSGSWTFTYDSDFPNNRNLPIVGDFLRGKYVDFVEVTARTGPTGGNQYTITTDGTVNDVYGTTPNLPSITPDIKFAYRINKEGWYSYKVVVKQTQQEYYNAYLPGILNGYPGQSGYPAKPSAPDPEAYPGGKANGIFPTNEVNLTAHTVLFNDNINKIPRDLTEVGPDQKQYRSAVTLYGRVTNSIDAIIEGSEEQGNLKAIQYGVNSQYYARLGNSKTAIAHSVSAIANAADFNMSFEDLSPNNDMDGRYDDEPINGNLVFYQIDTNPLIARISTLEKSIGATNLKLGASPDPDVTDMFYNAEPPYNMRPFLAIYETKPVESLLNIYWESTSGGLISDLNADILTGFEGATSFSNRDWYLDETMSDGDFVTNWFWPISLEGSSLMDSTVVLGTVIDGNGNPTENFELEVGTAGPNQGSFRIKIAEGVDFVFTEPSYYRDVYEFPLVVTREVGGSEIVTTLYIGGITNGEGSLTNIAPTFDAIPPQGIALGDTVVLDRSVWNTALAQNGTIIGDYNITEPPGQNELDLQYTFTASDDNPFDVTAINPSTDEPYWKMDILNGEITQDPVVIANSTMTNGLYNLTLKLNDANNAAPGGLEATQYITISVGYTQLNIQTDLCTLQPIGDADTVASDYLALLVAQDRTANDGEGDSLYNSQLAYDGVWYISKTQLTIDDFRNDGIESLNADNNKVFWLNENQTGGVTGHKTGTIAFTTNITQENKNLSGGNSAYFTASFFFENTQTYWRVAGTNAWLPITRDNDYNNTGLYTQATTAPNNYELNASTLCTVDGSSIAYAIYNRGREAGWQSSGSSWLQVVQASSIYDFPYSGGTQEIEYAVVIRKLANWTGNMTSDYEVGDNAVAWVTVDDLHYPKCVPFQGTNLAIDPNEPAEPPTYKKSYKYVVSDYGDNYAGEAPTPTNEVFAHTPYGEYADSFYNDDLLTDLKLPPDDNNLYLSKFQVSASEFPGMYNTPWTGDTGESGVILEWSAGFAPSGTTGTEGQGTKLPDPSIDNGTAARQRTIGAGYPGYEGAVGVNWHGTLRLSGTVYEVGICPPPPPLP